MYNSVNSSNYMVIIQKLIKFARYILNICRNLYKSCLNLPKNVDDKPGGRTNGQA